MDSQDTVGVVECAIGVRETVCGDGATKRRLLAHCDHRRESVELMDCYECDRRVRVHLPTARAAGAVECRRDASDLERPSIDPGLRVPVRLVMERDAACLQPDVTVDMAARLLLEWHAAGAPVIDEAGHPVGAISLADVLRPRPDAAAAGRIVGDVMSPLVFTVFENTELSRAAAVMSSVGLQQLPVVRGDGTMAGTLSTADVTRWVAGAGGGAVGWATAARRG